MIRLDWYIIRKFLGTFFFSIVLILSIAIVFDLTEKMDDFFENQVPLREIIFDYYLPFIPYYMNMFSSLFIFISVIYFTSKLAGNSEFIAMHAAGMSYHRLMVPYAFSATLLFVLGIFMGGWIIPKSSSCPSAISGRIFFQVYLMCGLIRHDDATCSRRRFRSSFKKEKRRLIFLR